jgi:hypothetical protein
MAGLTRPQAAAVVRHFEEIVRQHENALDYGTKDQQELIGQRYEDRRERLVLRLMGQEP